MQHPLSFGNAVLCAGDLVKNLEPFKPLVKGFILVMAQPISEAQAEITDVQ
jgi:hypothetical protein